MSAKADQIEAYIGMFCRQWGYGPTLQEIAKDCGMSSTSVVSYHLQQLRHEGRVSWQKGRTRTLRVAREVTA